MKKTKIRHTLFISLLISLSANAENLDSIVVTSDFRDTQLSKAIGSLSVITSEVLDEHSHEPIENILGKVANVNYTSGASRAHYFQIRGIGERSQFINPVNPSVGLILDGIDISQSALALTPFDLKQIEVLRGPQGTTFGANGLAGVIVAKSNEATNLPELHIEGSLGNYNTNSFGIAGGGAIIKDKLLGRVSLYQKKSDGFMQNSFLHKDDTSNIDELSFKGALKWILSDSHTIDLHFLHVDVDNGYDDWTFDSSRVSHADEPGFDKQKLDGLSIKSSYQINPNMHIVTSISGSKSKVDYGYDEDWSYKGEFSDDLGPYSSTDRYKRDRDQFDADIRVVSDKCGKIFNGSTDWTVGVYYKTFSEDLKRIYTYLDTPYTSSYETKNMALYTQFDTQLKDKLTLITGLRAERWESDFNDKDKLKIESDETLSGGKIGLKYQASKDKLFYIALSKGYKPGGVNPNNSLPKNARSFDTESLYNLDLGLNSSHLGDRLKSRLNLFYGKRKDQQVKSSMVNLRDDGSSEFIDFIANAAKTHYYGLESEITFQANDSLRFFSSIGLLKAEFDEYKDPNPDSIDVEGRAPAQSPKYQYDIGVDYFVGEYIKLSSDIEGKGSYYFSNRHNAKASSYTLINASATIFDGKWALSLWGRNLSDEDYEVRGFGSFGNNPAKGYAVETYTQKGAPKTYGLTLSYDY